MKCISFNRAVSLSIFYIVFYGALAAFTALMFVIFSTTLNEKEPKWKLDQSLIGTNPGMSFRPRTLDNIFAYKAGDANYAKIWKEKLDSFLDPYLNPRHQEQLQVCFLGQQPAPDHICDFRLLTSDFAPCLPEYGYGFNPNNTDEGPCIFLKINKVFDWIPQLYSSDNAPPEMSQDLVEKIKEVEQWNNNGRIWVDCVPTNSTNPEDVGPITYHPHQGFEKQYFPYKNVEGYLSPLVAIHFKKPKHGVLLTIECRAWAANIRHDLKNSHGVVRFALQIYD